MTRFHVLLLQFSDILKKNTTILFFLIFEHAHLFNTGLPPGMLWLKQRNNNIAWGLFVMSDFAVFSLRHIKFSLNRYRLIASSKPGSDIIGSHDPLCTVMLESWYKWDEVGMDIPFASSAECIVQYLLFFPIKLFLSLSFFLFLWIRIFIAGLRQRPLPIE